MRIGRALRIGGFTLIELIIVIGVIGILVTFGYSGLDNVLKRSRDSKRISDINEIIRGMRAYEADHNVYPGEGDTAGVQLSQHCVSDLRTDLEGNQYLETMAQDPLGSTTGCTVDSAVAGIDDVFFYGFDYVHPVGAVNRICISVNHMETQWGIDQLVAKYGQQASTSTGGDANIGTGGPLLFNYCF